MVEVTLLGSAQDGGVPQPGCSAACCADVGRRLPVSLGVVINGENHLIEATRNLTEQMEIWGNSPDEIWLTHAHLGHVDGLGLFGKEVMNSDNLALNMSESMQRLFASTPMWKRLESDGNLIPQNFSNALEAIRIPHRGEHSDTHAFIVRGENKSLLFMPDHDTWKETLVGQTLREWLSELRVDIALIDGTFWSSEELLTRTQSDVPHPPVKETLQMLGQRLPQDPRIVFIHLNHTNPLCKSGKERDYLLSLGWEVGQEGMTFQL